MRRIKLFPLFFILFITYCAIAWVDFQKSMNVLNQKLLQLRLPSEAIFTISLDYLLVAIGVIMLFFEIFKSTYTSTSSIIEHIFSMFVFIGFLVGFLVVPFLGTPAFLVLTMMSLLDVITGFIVGIPTARRDFGINQ